MHRPEEYLYRLAMFMLFNLTCAEGSALPCVLLAGRGSTVSIFPLLWPYQGGASQMAFFEHFDFLWRGLSLVLSKRFHASVLHAAVHHYHYHYHYYCHHDYAHEHAHDKERGIFCRHYCIQRKGCHSLGIWGFSSPYQEAQTLGARLREASSTFYIRGMRSRWRLPFRLLLA